MKKDRNAFFDGYNMNQGVNMGQMGPNMMMPGGGMQPGGMPSGMGNMPGMPMPTDIDARIAKLERAINRLETRVSKLEGEAGSYYPEHDFNQSNSMYMV